jgi:putative endonuclease
LEKDFTKVESFSFYKNNMYYTYILQSESTGKYYIGYTSNLEDRIDQHNHPLNSKNKTTKRFQGPWKLVYSESFSTKTEAIQREKNIKSWKSKRSIQELIDSRR